MIIQKAEFVTSSEDISQCPSDGSIEFAFIGRSNVGKSSLINMLTGVKGLAKTSQTPGKTQLINHFFINELFYIVDLPGYGFAKVPKKLKEMFEEMITTYLRERSELASLFVLVDVRHEPMKIDIDFINDMGERGIPFSIVFTKADKLSKTALANNVEAYKKRLLQDWEELPPIFITSSEQGTGREELLDYFSQILGS